MERCTARGESRSRAAAGGRTLVGDFGAESNAEQIAGPAFAGLIRLSAPDQV
jgi:hypothetical protein